MVQTELMKSINNQSLVANTVTDLQNQRHFICHPKKKSEGWESNAEDRVKHQHGGTYQISNIKTTMEAGLHARTWHVFKMTASLWWEYITAQERY